MRRTLSAALLSVAVAPMAYADSIDLRLNDNMAEITYATSAANLGLQDGDVSVGFLFNTDNDLVGSVGFQTVGRVDNYLSFSIGLKGYGVRVDEPREGLAAFAVSGGVGYTIPNSPVTVALGGAVAPDILTFGDSSGIQEWSLRLQAQLLPNAAVYVGWRELRVQLDDAPTHRVDNDLHLGLKLGF